MRRKKRDTSSEGQLELKFEATAKASESLPSFTNNVLQVNFGSRRAVPLDGNKNERALIDRILENAQKLKW